MNRRSLFKGAFASFFVFLGATVLPKPKEPCWHVKAANKMKESGNWIGTNIPRKIEGWHYKFSYNSVTEQAFREIEESDIRVYRNTGKCDLNSLGEET